MAHIAVAIHLALSVWGTPACGQPQVTAQPIVDSAYVGSRALAYPTECRIVFNTEDGAWKTQDWQELCTVMVHEWGHLTGHGHSADPKSVMNPHPVPYWRCGQTARGTWPKGSKRPKGYQSWTTLAIGVVGPV